ncbi:hypothetical protein, partial [Burkholderia vietnamiensis]|uniref:hypothetical protein n=1 Tax=Burkholderia vietnamiensis TaxID=60552 RepID=UPI001E47F088
ASDSRRRADNALFNRLAHKNADRFRQLAYGAGVESQAKLAHESYSMPAEQHNFSTSPWKCYARVPSFLTFRQVTMRLNGNATFRSKPLLTRLSRIFALKIKGSTEPLDYVTRFLRSNART